MRSNVPGLAVVLLVGIVTRASGGTNECITCHPETTATNLGTTGHAPDVGCIDCHAERRPGRVGRHHRSIAPCRKCHEAHGDLVGHPPQSVRSVTAETRNCVNCHQPHGSANATLVQPNIPRFGRANTITFTGAGGAVPGGFVDPTDPGHGLCEVCHRKTDFYLASGAGKPHFTDDCTLCHDHTVAFQPVVTLANCPICHADEAARFEEASRHSSLFVCTNCHTDTGTTPGPGHETVPSCGQCHSTIETHAPAGRPPFPCT